MIKFSGELSEKTKKWRINQEQRGVRLVIFVVCILFSIPTIIVALLVDPVNFIWLIAWWLIFLILGFAPIKGKSLGLVLPFEVTIIHDIIDSKGEKFDSYRNLDDVKKVIDFGEWYQVIFYFPYKDLRFVCQKDLIKEGTIEEFENLFEGKIVRKIKE